MLSKLSSQPKSSAYITGWFCIVVLLMLPLTGEARVSGCSFSFVTTASELSNPEQAFVSGNQVADMSMPASPESARMLVLTENLGSAVVEYALLVASDSTNIALNAEYAYALALCGIYDAALVRLDRFWNRKINNPDAAYMASQVFRLMGHEQLADELWKETTTTKPPSWISAKAAVLLQKYGRKNKTAASASRNDLIADFKRANRLAAQNALLRSLALFEEITTGFPQEYLPFVGYSIALEQGGFLLKSAQMLEKALALTGNSPEEAETKQFLTRRLTSLRATINTTNQLSAPSAAKAKTTEKNSKPMMAYAGGMIQADYVNFNLRYGYFLTENGNLSVNLGWTNNSAGLFTNLGLLYYQRYKVFVSGMGLSGNFGNGNAVLYMKLSPGLSFMNKKKTASWDLFWDVQFPFQNKYATTIGFSIGRSYYFGNR